jgi:hypothetical protein
MAEVYPGYNAEVASEMEKLRLREAAAKANMPSMWDRVKTGLGGAVSSVTQLGNRAKEAFGVGGASTAPQTLAPQTSSASASPLTIETPAFGLGRPRTAEETMELSRKTPIRSTQERLKYIDENM